MFTHKGPDVRIISHPIMIHNHTQLAKMSFDKIFDLTAGVYFYFYDVPGIMHGAS